MGEPASGNDLSPVVAAFGPAAEEYERGRPGYPAQVGEILVRAMALGPGTRVCDLAAGTGKFTRLLIDLGCEVVAVEPVAGMRAELARVLPEVEVRDGTAERLPLEDGSVDTVTVAQAFHWFEMQPALAEIHRVVRSAGGLAMVWNVRDEEVPWIGEMSRLIDWHHHPASSYQKHDWAGEVAASNRFTPLERASTEWEQPMTRQLLADRVRSISYVAASPPEEQARLARQVLELVEGFEEPFPMPYRTIVYWCRRR